MLGTHLTLWKLRPASHYDQAPVPSSDQHAHSQDTLGCPQDCNRMMLDAGSVTEWRADFSSSVGLSIGTHGPGPVPSGSWEEGDGIVSPSYMQLVSQEALGSRSVLHMADVLWACLLTCRHYASTD